MLTGQAGFGCHRRQARGHDRKIGQKVLHPVTAFANRSRLVLGQEAPLQGLPSSHTRPQNRAKIQKFSPTSTKERP
jgi:hypothetical protein